MNEQEFLNQLSKTTKAYRWRVNEGGKIRAKVRNHVSKVKSQIGVNEFDPVTAVTRFTKNGTYAVWNANQVPNINQTVKSNAIDAADAQHNVGHCQVLRGRMKKALGL